MNPPPKIPNAQSSPIRLLYAEDNPQDADLTQFQFDEYAPEFELKVVATGAACLEQIQLKPPELLLLDYHLPDIDGVEILKILRHQAPSVPVVMVTGVGNEELIARALRLGAVNYIPKRGNYLESLPGLVHEVLDAFHRKQGQLLSASAVPQRILYVEHLTMDIELTLQFFSEMAPHFAVEVVHSCSDAMVRLAQPHKYDLVLVDLRMPDQSGLNFIREVKRLRLRLPPFIIVSGTGDEEAAIATLQLGAEDYIIKREGYLSQLTYRIEHTIAHERLKQSNIELKAAREAAELATRIKSRFIDIAAHELRTPVTAFSILLQLSQMQLEKGHPVDIPTLVRLRGQAARLSRLVVDLLDVSRLDRGVLTLKKELTDMVSLVSECLANFGLQAPTRRFIFAKPEQPIQISIDPIRVFQVVSNLIDNAIKYTPENTPIEVTLKATPTLVHVSVKDQGPGISDQLQAVMFNPFSRGSSEQVEQPAGLGLGLFICRGIIELHGGTIGVQSKMGVGSTFSFEFPRELPRELPIELPRKVV